METTVGTLSNGRIVNAIPDPLDFRDKMYTANLYEVPMYIRLDNYRKVEVPILDQGKEGACTGFGLATVINYLLRVRKYEPDVIEVSPRMLYEMAKRYDEWPGEDYSGSSARGAIKGWHKHGVCAHEFWEYKPEEKDRKNLRLNYERANNAIRRPLGAYYRVNHLDIVSMHTALAEVGVLYATAVVHDGWSNIGQDGIIRYESQPRGGHAFAIVAYDENGFWIQNSWGEKWGNDGFGLISYDDWLANGTDVWVARLGAPIITKRTQTISIAHSAAANKSNAYSFCDLRPHIISLGNNGGFYSGGEFGTSENDVEEIFENDIPTSFKKWHGDNKTENPKLLIYAHGGLVPETTAIQRLADYRPALLENHIFPVSVIWHTDYWSSITNVLKDAMRRRRPEGFLDSAKDFMLNRLDDMLEPVARALTGKLVWDEMKQNAKLASTAENGGMKHIVQHLKVLKDKFPDLEIHIVGHSAGSIVHAWFLQLLNSNNIEVDSCTLWAPACTMKLFNATYKLALKTNTLKHCTIFTLTDEAEQDDNCAAIYNKSLLYLVSNAFEERMRQLLPPRNGEPLLGMHKFIKDDYEFQQLIKEGKIDHILSPNQQPEGSIDRSTSHHHGDFDDDKPTVFATLQRILKNTAAKTTAKIEFKQSAGSLQERRIEASRI